MLCAFVISESLHSQPNIIFTPVITNGLNSPVDVVDPNDGTNRVFIVQRGGTIRVFDNTFALLSNNFLTIGTDFTSGGERGLLSLVFHPDYENNRYFFVYYTNGAGGVNIDRFRTDANNPNAVAASSRTNILSVSKPVVYDNHNGGKLNFGSDGHLYAGFGDSGDGGDPGNLSQNGNSLWGKMIRINVDNFDVAPYYTIPLDNPFITDPNVLDEIFSLGLRNPWRWSFDRLTGNTWIADVGQNEREEVNNLSPTQARGANYGWRCYEGTLPYNTTGCLPANNYVQPVLEYPHNNTTGGFSITGGYVYRGSQYPAMRGYYLSVDFVSNIGFITNVNTLSTTLQSGFPGGIAGFGERANGELLALTLGGRLLALSTNTVLPIQLLSFSGQTINNSNQLTWQIQNDGSLKHFDVESSADGIAFQKISSLVPGNNNQFVFREIAVNKTTFYRLKMIHLDATISFSNQIQLINGRWAEKNIIEKNIAGVNTLRIHVNIGDNSNFNLLNSLGQVVYSISNYQPNQIIRLGRLPKGLYLASVTLNGKSHTEKIMVY